MNDIEKVKKALQSWMDGLDSGNLEQVIAATDPEVVICNEHKPTSFGLAAIRKKYGPIIENFNITSKFNTEYIKVYGDFATVVGFFINTATNKKTDEIHKSQGRLILVYRRHEDGNWKMLLDIDNNDEKS